MENASLRPAENQVLVAEDEPGIPFQTKLLSSFLNFTNYLCYRKDGTINRKLQAYFEYLVPANPIPVDGVSTADVIIDVASGVWARVFTPAQDKQESEQEETSSNESDKNLPIIIYYHGGGFVGLQANDAGYDRLCRNLTKACNAVTISVNYRRAPEFPFPTVYDDSYKVFDWLLSSESRSSLPSRVDLSQCFLMGDSAGGNITHFMGCRALQNDISPIKLRGMVELQPFFGGEERTPAEVNVPPLIINLKFTDFAWRAFLPAGANRDHYACNVVGPNGLDISNVPFPPIFIVTASFDILQDRQAVFIQALKDLGKDVTTKHYVGAYHGCYAIPFGGWDQKIMSDVHDFIRSRIL